MNQFGNLIGSAQDSKKIKKPVYLNVLSGSEKRIGSVPVIGSKHENVGSTVIKTKMVGSSDLTSSSTYLKSNLIGLSVVDLKKPSVKPSQLKPVESISKLNLEYSPSHRFDTGIKFTISGFPPVNPPPIAIIPTFDSTEITFDSENFTFDNSY